MLVLYPYKNALWALRLCNRGRLLSVRPAPTMFDHLYASLHKAFGRSISASLPKPQTPSPWEGATACRKVCFYKIVRILYPYPQTPFPRKGAILLGLPPLDQARMLWLLAKSYKQGRLCQLNRAVARCNGTNS